MFHSPGVQVVALVPVAGPVPPADHGGGAVRQGFVDLLRRDEVDVTIDAAGGDDQIFTRDDFG